MFAVIGPSMKEYRGPPAFFFCSASKLRSRSHSSSTPCSSSGRSNDDPTGVNRSFSFVAAISTPNTKTPSRSRDGACRGTTRVGTLRVPTHRLLNGVALRPGLVASRLSSDGIGVDRPLERLCHEVYRPNNHY